MTDKITLEQARGLLARAVLTQGPDFVYRLPGDVPGCYNVPIGAIWQRPCAIPEDSPKRKTGCLVGTAMKLSGIVPVEVLTARNTSGVWAFAEYIKDDDAVSYLEVAQGAQDHGMSWGEAYKRAEEWAGRRESARRAPDKPEMEDIRGSRRSEI